MPHNKKKPKKNESLDLSDRLVTAALGAIFALVTGSFYWFFVLLAVARRRSTEGVPFWPVLVFALVMAVIGFVIGPEKMMDIFERIWRRKDKD